MCLKFLKYKRRQKGQAALEYVLLLFVTLSIIGGSVYQFSSAFRNFADQLFGKGENTGYIGCLIEEGLLPGDESDECTPPRFDLKSGKKVAFAGGSSSNNGGAKNSSKNNLNNNPEPNPSRSAGHTNESGGGGIPTNSQDGIGFKIAKAPSSENTQKTGSGNTDSNTGNNGFSDPGVISGESLALGDKRSRAVPVSEADQIGKGKAGASEKIPLTVHDIKTAREIAAEKARKKKAEEVGDGFTFGNYIKYIIIAALLFSIIFFIGSQVVAVSRGRRRN